MKAKFGRYIFLKKLAVGGMAEVYLARRVSFGGFAKFVVIKRLLPEHKARSAYERLFLAEARTGALLNHPNIAGLYDLGKLDDHYFMAMEFVDGVSVAEVMTRAGKERKPVPLGVALRICFGVADALYYAHHTLDEHGEPLRIIHHDITPPNIQVSFEGDVKLLDFGVATRMGRPVAGGRRGKPGYISPEAMRKEALDARSDLYSLGVVLYELTTGKRVAARSAEGNGAAADLDERPEFVPPTRLDPYFPVSLEELIMPALSEDVGARPPDARVFSRALREVGRKLGFDTSAQALAAYLRDLMGTEIAAHRAELADLARRSDPVRKPEPGAAEAAAAEAGALGAESTGELTAMAQAAVMLAAAKDRSDEGPGEGLVPQVSGEFDAQDAGFADPGLLEAPPPASTPPAPVPSPAAPSPSRLRRPLVVAVLAIAALAAGRFWGERAAHADADFGSLEVETTPPGARVFDGERLLGITPFRNPKAPVGKALALRVVLDGHAEWHGDVALEPERRHRTLSISLEPAR